MRLPRLHWKCHRWWWPIWFRSRASGPAPASAALVILKRARPGAALRGSAGRLLAARLRRLLFRARQVPRTRRARRLRNPHGADPNFKKAKPLCVAQAASGPGVSRLQMAGPDVNKLHQASPPGIRRFGPTYGCTWHTDAICSGGWRQAGRQGRQTLTCKLARRQSGR